MIFRLPSVPTGPNKGERVLQSWETNSCQSALLSRTPSSRGGPRVMFEVTAVLAKISDGEAVGHRSVRVESGFPRKLDNL